MEGYRYFTTRYTLKRTCVSMSKRHLTPTVTAVLFTIAKNEINLHVHQLKKVVGIYTHSHTHLHTRIFNHKKEQKPVICCNVDGTGGHYVKCIRHGLIYSVESKLLIKKKHRTQ